MPKNIIPQWRTEAFPQQCMFFNMMKVISPVILQSSKQFCFHQKFFAYIYNSLLTVREGHCKCYSILIGALAHDVLLCIWSCREETHSDIGTKKWCITWWFADKNWFHPKQQQKLLKHSEQYFGIILKN